MVVLASFSRLHSLLENQTFVSGLIFHLYWVFFPSVQMRAFVPVGATVRYKCPLIEARQGLLLSTRYKCLTIVPGGGSGRYKCKAKPFVPGLAFPRYKRGASSRSVYISYILHPPAFSLTHLFLSFISIFFCCKCGGLPGRQPAWRPGWRRPWPAQPGGASAEASRRPGMAAPSCKLKIGSCSIFVLVHTFLLVIHVVVNDLWFL
jgi:hypothetical protein